MILDFSIFFKIFSLLILVQFSSFISPFHIVYILSLYNQSVNLLLTTQKKKNRKKIYIMQYIKYFDCKGEQEKLD